ncbi:MAG: glutamate racemase [Salinivirgaceae bacterium]|jgi:glutamate racemase
MNKNPIGIFDSGVGGLTVWKHLYQLLPNEKLIYLADSLHCPYGTKPAEEIIELSRANTRFLINKGCKLIVVACNTATASAIETLRAEFNIPFVGMEPAIKPAAVNTTTGKIGVLATKGTFEGRLFKETSQKYAQGVDTLIQVGEGLVELVENNEMDSEQSRKLLVSYINPMIEAGVDQIVLGCTHYPFFIPLLKQIVPETIQIIDPAPAIAMRVKNILIELGMQSNSKEVNPEFYSTGGTKVIDLLVTKITGQSYPATKIDLS